MSEGKTERNIIETRKLIRKGGSVAVTIPAEVVKMLDLEDTVTFVKEGNKVYLDKSNIYQKSADFLRRGESILGHPMTQDEIDRLIEVLKKKD